MMPSPFENLLEHPSPKEDNAANELGGLFAENLMKNHLELVRDTAWKMMELENLNNKN